MEYILSIPIVFMLLSIIIFTLQIKIGNKNKLIQKYLTHDEQIIKEGNLVYIEKMMYASFIFTIGLIIAFFVLSEGKKLIAFVILFYFIAFASIPILHAYTLKHTTKLIITSKRLILAYGTFSNNVVDYSLDKISNITFNQGVLGRVFSFSKITLISTSGAELKIGNQELKLKNAEEFIKAFVSLRA